MRNFHPTKWLLTPLLMLLLPCCLHAEIPSPSWKAWTINGKTISCQKLTLSNNGSLQLIQTDNNKIPLPLHELLRIHRLEESIPPPPTSPYILMANGDRLPATVTEANSDRLTIKQSTVANAKTIQLPLAGIQGIWQQAPQNGISDEDYQWRWENTPQKEDRIVCINGDKIHGIWRKLQESRIHIKQSQRTVNIAWKQVASVRMNQQLIRPQLAKPATIRIILQDGCTLSLANVHIKDNLLQGQWVYGHPVRLPLKSIVAMESLAVAKKSLADIKPEKVEHTPFFNTRWDYVENGNAGRRWIQLGGHVFHRGVGVHSKTVLTYRIPPKSTHFSTWVGLDDKAGKLGNVDIQIRLDEKIIYQRKNMVSGKMVWICIPLKGGKLLRLQVDFGKAGDIGDHVNWADACFLQDHSAP